MLLSAAATFFRFFTNVSSTIVFLVIGLVTLPAHAGEMVLSGVYQGKNLFVQNPFAGDNQNYCVEEVYINNVKKMSGIKQSAFEIDLSYLEVDDAVNIRITHKDGCAPKVINPQVLRPSATFQFNSLTVDHNSLDWTTSGETPKYLYYVEQFINSSWFTIKKFEAKNTGAGIYSLPITPNFGLNKYRIKVQNEDNHKMFYSRVVTFESKEEPVNFYPKSVTSKITLSKPIPYEVLDVKGKVLKKGKGTEIALNDLKTGVYYLNFDNRTEKFFKK